jgi:pre-mRNA-processing factor 6
VQQKSQASQAIQRCPDDPVVIAAVAELFAIDRKYEKARKWLDRAVRLDPDFGDSWARFYAFERSVGNDSQREDVQKRCLQADPKHGDLWTCVRKDPAHRTKDLAECLELVADLVVEQKAETNGNK